MMRLSSGTAQGLKESESEGLKSDEVEQLAQGLKSESERL